MKELKEEINDKNEIDNKKADMQLELTDDELEQASGGARGADPYKNDRRSF
eukprot:GABW01005066.1.p1 GENE.GABW01005066.1~~GABW01005066.1.p1  ORF type:complete len:51 (+),score=0.25 GABW01005066.1:184-336(+)